MKVGITGHQNLVSENIERWVRAKISEAIDQFGTVEGYSSLAKGADQVFATVLLEKHQPYVAVFPCENIEDTFDNKTDLKRFRELAKRASRIVVMPFVAPSEKAFFAAGKYVVQNCDIVLAIWNGLPARGLGGTADVVKYALKKHKPVLHINPSTMSIERRV